MLSSSSSSIIQSLIALSAAGVAALIASPARADVVYVDQTRTVQAEASHNMNPEVSDVKSAPDLGTFNGEAVANLVDDFDQDFAISHVTQVSTLGAARAEAHGTFVFTIGGEFARGHSVFSTTFDVTDSPQNFALSYLVSVTPSDLVHGVPFHASLDLRRLDGSGGGTSVVPALDTDLSADQDVNAPVRVTDTRTGTLAPGRYALDFDMRGYSVDYNHSYGGGYELSIDLSDAGPGPTPNPIPLPPAAWTGLAAFAGFGGVSRWRRCRR